MRQHTVYERMRREYPREEAPFIYSLIDEMKRTRPYKGIRILVNIPIFKNSFLMFECLEASGADVTITKPVFVESQKESIDLIRETGLKFIPEHKFDGLRFDISLDCCAELSEHMIPSIGAAEITQTGAKKYKLLNPSYPVVSVDDSAVKRLEDGLGSADGFMRALAKLLPYDFVDKTVLLFGFGKVGIGIARRLQRKGNEVIVVDQSPGALDRAKSFGYEGVLLSDKSAVRGKLKRADCVVTATGSKGFVSREFEAKEFASKILVNVGAEDEFGSNFTEENVLFGKRPVNFCLDVPTTIQFLDPAFYAHHRSIDILLKRQFEDGVHPFPPGESEEVIRKWCNFHETELREFEQLYGDHRHVL